MGATITRTRVRVPVMSGMILVGHTEHWAWILKDGSDRMEFRTKRDAVSFANLYGIIL